MKKTLSRSSFKKLKKDKTALICFIFLIFVCAMALLAPVISPYPFDEQNMNKILKAPSFEHWLGTDDLGRDLLSRLIYGSRISMAVGVMTALISLILGTAYGALSGWFGGRVDAFMMRVLDIFYAFPTLVLIILMKIVFESLIDIENPEIRSLISILAGIGVVSWLNLGRVVRGQMLQLKESLYVEAARAMGAGHFRIIFRQILPNMLGPVIVLLTFQIPINILSESFLSFLGLGLQPPYSSWGILASEGWKSLQIYPHLMAAPGVALFLTMLAFNLLGDSLKDALDPQS